MSCPLCRSPKAAAAAYCAECVAKFESKHHPCVCLDCWEQGRALFWVHRSQLGNSSQEALEAHFQGTGGHVIYIYQSCSQCERGKAA